MRWNLATVGVNLTVSGNLPEQVAEKTMKPVTFVAVTLSLLLIGCQDENVRPTVSIDEAKFTAVAFDEPLEAPPRTANDILVTLPSFQGRSDVCSFLRKTSTDVVLAAASKLPPTKERGNAVEFLTHQASLQFQDGDFPTSVEFQRAALDIIPNTGFFAGLRAQNIAVLANYQAYANDFGAADSLVSQAISLAAGIRNESSYSWGRDKALIDFNVGVARAAITEGNGDLVGAEKYYREAIEVANVASLASPDITDWSDPTLSRSIYSQSSVSYQLDFAILALARNLMRQGQLLKAEVSVRAALQSRFHPSSMLLALTRLSEVLYEQGRYDEAAELADKTAALYESKCVAPANLHLALVNDLLGRALVAEERWAEAADHYNTIRDDMSGDPGSFDRLFTGSLYWALALLRSGDEGKAIEQLEIGLQRAGDRLGEDHYMSLEVRGFLAMARSERGERETALREFQKVVPLLVERSREADYDSTTGTARNWRLKLILEAYINLLTQAHSLPLNKPARADAVAEAFVLAEHARSSSVVHALSASGARAALPNAELADLARREQDSKRRISALYKTLSEVFYRPVHLQEEDLAKSIKAKIESLRGARETLIKEIETRFPKYADLVNPKPATVEQARSALRPGETLIATYVGEDQTYVWAVPFAGEVLFSVVSRSRAEIAFDAVYLRGALDSSATTLGDIPEFDVEVAYSLYQSLLQPVRAGWQNANRLLIVAHGPLGQLPFSLLPIEPVKLERKESLLFESYRKVSWLARTHSVTVLPSVASLVALRTAPSGKSRRRAFAGFGDPWFSPAQAAAAQNSVPPEPEIKIAEFATGNELSVRGMLIRLRNFPQTRSVDSAELDQLPRLPDTAEEVRTIAITLGADLTRDVFTGKEATEGQVKTMDLSTRRVIAFATHGLVPGDLNGLTQPALAFTSPAVAGGEDDGLLTMGEVLGIRLDADWVVLSACNTAAADGAGAEAVSGLGRAFFYAGARALLVSNWPVHSDSAKSLTTDLFRHQATDPDMSRSEALQKAMIDMIDQGAYIDKRSGRAVFSYAHPIFWAPFSLIGDGGGGAPGT